jgi:hypothetical protein
MRVYDQDTDILQFSWFRSVYSITQTSVTRQAQERSLREGTLVLVVLRVIRAQRRLLNYWFYQTYLVYLFIRVI